MRILAFLSIAAATFSVAKAAYPITGTFTGMGPASGQRPARQNIVNLQRDSYTWPLYIRALSAMQAAPQNDLLSWYQVAGIHGRPFTTWDNSNDPDGANNAYTGYCTHDSPLFLTWHRPYLALYEQILAQRVQSIVTQYSGKPDYVRWRGAANKFRIPYWDWAETMTMPAIMSQPQITVQFATGSRTIDNPLYTYRFHPLNAADFSGGGFLATQPQTIRGSNIDSLLSTWGVRGSVYNTFNTKDYLRYTMQSSGGANMENVHGSVHMAVAGGSGDRHMAQLAFSAFDPVFWLHHANVDRLAALWSQIYPDKYLPAGGAHDPYGNFALNAGSTVYPNTGLRPFSRTASQVYWDSLTSKATSNFGYTYPEINDWSRNPVQQKSDAAAAVNVLYSPWSFLGKRNATAELPTSRQWFVTVSCKKFALDKSYNVLVYLGEPPANSADWLTASNLAAVMPVFVPPKMPGVAPPRLSDLTTNNEFVLDAALDKAGVTERDAAVLEPYLNKKLTYRVLQLDGTVVPPEKVAGLKIGVYDVEMTPPQDITELPTYGEEVQRPGATRGKPGSVSA